MKAKDTVINNREALSKVWIPCETCERERSLEPDCIECMAFCHRKAQAEVSFLAGQRELMEWVESHSLYDGHVSIRGKQLQIKKKELELWKMKCQ